MDQGHLSIPDSYPQRVGYPHL